MNIPELTNDPSKGPKHESIADRFNTDEVVEEAVEKAVRNAVADHKKKGNAVAIWQNGKLVWLSPDDIPENPSKSGGGM